MRQVLLVALLVVSGCGIVDTADEPAETLPPSSAPTTAEESRAEVGQRIVDSFDPDGTAPYMQANPEAIAKMASAYCVDLESSRAEADAQLERAVGAYLSLYSGSTASASAQASAAGLMANVIGEVAVEELCPDMGSDKYLPDN